MTELTPERLQELRRIAEAATPGLWEVVGLDGYGCQYALRMPHRSGRTWYGVEGIKRREDAEYFVAMNRNTVLALLDEIEALQAEIERLRREVREWMCDGCNTVYPGPPQPGIWCAQCPRCGGDTAPRDVIERRRLEREIERLREQLRLSTVDQAISEVEAMKKEVSNG